MHYDPIKQTMGNLVRENRVLRRMFYGALGALFLREWHVKRTLRALFRENSIGRVFDAGSGFGQYSYYIAKRYPRAGIYAVDVKEEQIRDCQRFFKSARLNHVLFAVEDLTQPHHRDEFDLVLSVDVMEHIPDDTLVFRNLYTALRSKGFLVVNTPAAPEDSVHKKNPAEGSFIDEHVRNGYSPKEIREKLTTVGFDVERIQFTYGPYGAIAWTVGIKIPMQLLGTSKLFFAVLPLYYLIALPISWAFMALDYFIESRSGGGLLVVARKP